MRDVGQRIQQARWTSPQTNRLLLEAGFGTYMSRWGGEPMPGADPNLIRTTDQCTTGAGVPGQPCEHGIANLTYRAHELEHRVGARGQLSCRRRRTSSAGIR